MSKINLIIFHPYSNIGGADLSLSKLINNLDHQKYKIEFICLNKQKIKRYLKKNIKIHIIKSSKVIFSIFKIRKIIKENSKLKYKKTIFFSNQNYVNIISYLITLGFGNNLKNIVAERNHISELYNFYNIKDFIIKNIIRNLMKLIYGQFDAIVGNSKELSKDLNRYISLKVLTIQNPLPQHQLKTKLFKKEKGRILNIGRLEKQKDQITLIKAMNLLSKYRDFQLTIIGDGSEYQNLINIISKFKLNKNIKILRKITNPKKFFLKNDLFISTSIYEGFPNVIAESISFNVPVISSNCKSGPREILMTTRGPDIFSMGNHEELSRKILNHFNNPSILNKKCLKIKKKLKNLNLKNYIKKYDKLFTKI